MAKYSKAILMFLGADWPLYMRRPFIVALGKAAERADTAVIAVNRPLCPFTTALRKPERFGELFRGERVEQLSANLYLYSPRCVLHDHLAPKIPGVMRLNIWALRTGLRKVFRALDISAKRPIIWYNYPQQAYVTRLFNDSYNVYDLYDSLFTILGPPGPNIEREAQCRESVDLLVTASESMREKYAKFYPESYALGNGLPEATYRGFVDDTGSATGELTEITSIAGPRIGYAGMIGERINWELINALAERRADWNFVFVGHKASAVPESVSRRANVHFLPAVASERVPAVLRSFDVGLMPYLDTEFFHDSNPLKFYEYAAAGLPSVCSPVKELERYPDQLVSVLAPEAALWERTIERMLADDRSELRKIGQQIAGERIWERLAENLLDRLLSLSGSV